MRGARRWRRLSLNYLPDDADAPPEDLYQFGLLPEDEARQAADAAIQNEHFNAVTLVPAGHWGGRMIEGFRSHYETLGGVVLESSRYNSEASDYGRPIQMLLNLDSSYARERRLQNTIGRDVRFEPRRRQDIEVIFMAAMPRQARLLEPQLEFHRAGDLPVYATSHVFSGGPGFGISTACFLPICHGFSTIFTIRIHSTAPSPSTGRGPAGSIPGCTPWVSMHSPCCPT